MASNNDKKKNTLFEIVNENDEVIGLEEIEKISKERSIIRTAVIWFFTRRGEIIFQRRAKDSVVLAGLLDSTVGGKVEPGASYEDTAIIEAMEETGLVIEKEKLIPLKKMRRNLKDDPADLVINNFSMQYAYHYPGEIVDLQIEEGKAEGFEAWHIDKILSLSDEEKKLFVRDFVTSPELLDIFRQIKKLI